MEQSKRRMVEAVKEAKSISITLNEGTLSRIKIQPISNKRFAHDVALSLQTYLIQEEKRIADGKKTIL